MKTNPIGIRFEERQLELIRKRENLTTPQSIVSFLMNEYEKIWGVQKTSVLLHHPKKEYDAPKMDLPTHDEPQWPINSKRKKSVEEYVVERMQLSDAEEYGEWLNKLNNDPFLSDKQKQLCKSATM